MKITGKASVIKTKQPNEKAPVTWENLKNKQVKIIWYPY